MSMEKKIFLVASILGLVSVILGAFAAHGLRDTLTTTSLESFQTGVRYQMYHAFFLFVIGIVLFSGSIYLLATNALTPINVAVLGPITPLGGVFLISAWGVLVGYLYKSKK
jgi:uncharacterized membrane protein YgdD (TMEM256/DUF423 family)